MNPVRSSLIKKLFISNKDLPMIGKASNGVKKNYIYGLIIIGVINIGFYYGLVLPQKVKADILFKEIEIKRVEAVALKPPSSFTELKIDITKFQDMLPRKTEMTKIIRELDNLARGSSLVIHDIAYESKKTREGNIFPISFSFPVEGKYSNVKNFIYKLESSKRLIAINDLNLEKASGKEDIRLNIKLTVYLKNG